ncbi:Xaa-Pro dipeptidase [Marinomonas agarivorans]|nr:Xaa-Pro dipeptidase [Marinomonas agarivorans]
MSELYAKHIATLLKRYRAALKQFKLDGILLSSGTKTYYFEDDLAHPFRAYSGAQQWLPFRPSPDTYILIQKSGDPILIWPIQDDFWHANVSLPSGSWHTEWTVIERPIEHDISDYTKGKYACIGPSDKHSSPFSPHLSQKESLSLQAFIDYDKAYKTEFEIEAIKQANYQAVAGHKAAKEAFLTGKSELCIYHDFLTASKQNSSQEPYSGIVALNEHASVLHYELKDPSLQPLHNTLLIDAGACVHGYASDITRTFTQDNGLFKTLLDSVDELQQNLAQQAVAGVNFKQLHNKALHGIAEILYQHKICALAPEDQVKKGVAQTFFPHGLGHLLGLKVHDAGGHQIDKAGTLDKPGVEAPFLRLTRTLEENMVITIEPGLYFIPMLIAKMQHEIPQHGCDIDLVEALLPFGGIRIEDNVVVGKEQSINLTRDAFTNL